MLAHEQQIVALHQNHSLSDDMIAQEMGLPLDTVRLTLAKYSPRTYGIPESEKERVSKLALAALEDVAMTDDPKCYGSKVRAAVFLYQEVNNRNEVKKLEDGPKNIHFHVHEANKAIEAARKAKERVINVPSEAAA